MYKKIITLVLAIAVAISASACGGHGVDVAGHGVDVTLGHNGCSVAACTNAGTKTSISIH